MKKTLAFLLAALSLLVISCKKDEPKPEPTPDPEAPVFVSAQLRGINGETTVIVGKPVKLTGKVTVVGSELSSLSVTIKNGQVVLVDDTIEMSGTSFDINKTYDLGLTLQDVEDAIRPTVTLLATNKDRMATEKVLTQEESVEIATPVYANALYLVDNAGHSYILTKITPEGFYHTSEDISEIGSSVRVCSEMNGDAPAGDIWGPFDTPEDPDYENRWIGWDARTEKITNMIDYTRTINLKEMVDGNGQKVYWAFELVHNCEVEFLNFGEGLLLQSDRFDCVEGNKARYTGHTSKIFEVYFLTDCKWLVIKNQWSDPDVLWITGANITHPMNPFLEAYNFDWFANPDWGNAASAVKISEYKWQLLLYMKDNFSIKAYDYYAWANELQWKSVTPETLQITEYNSEGKDGNFGIPGPNFSTGLWMLTFDKSTGEVGLEKYTGTLLGGMVTEETTDPEPPAPLDGEGIYLADEAGHIYEMTLESGDNYVVTSPTGITGTVRVVSRVLDGAVTPDATEFCQFALDPVYTDGVGDAAPWKIVYNAESKTCSYREGVWCNGGTGEDEVLTWVLNLPHNAEVQFIDFPAPISEMVNLAIFDNVNDEAKTARYIGVSSDYEMHYNAVNKWVLFIALWGGDTKDFLIIGNQKASFPQAPYCDYPIYDDFATHNSCGGILHLNQVEKGVFRSYVYAVPGFIMYIYGSISWGAITNGWDSATPDVCIHDATSWVGFDQIRPGTAFTEGLYLLEYNQNTNKVSMVKK